MSMLSSTIWVLDAPPGAVWLDSPAEAARLVEAGGTVCLPSFEAGRRTLELVGYDPSNTECRVAAALMQPRRQRTYDPDDLEQGDKDRPGEPGGKRITRPHLWTLEFELENLEARIEDRHRHLHDVDDYEQGLIRHWLHGADRARSRLVRWIGLQQRGEHVQVETAMRGPYSFAVCVCGVGFEGALDDEGSFATLRGHRPMGGSDPDRMFDGVD